ncbi:hypothetical protein H6F61_22455 [Cyanobacteria bacterium FACHB-472]|nr:hypothetical protein [Cyanobacteria bacterium FACHB-472]
MKSGNIEQFKTLVTRRDDPNYSQVSGYISKDLALRFKIACTSKEITQSEALESAVARWLEEEDILVAGGKDSEKSQSSPQTIAELVERNYHQLLKLGGVGADRLEALKDGAKPTVRELVFLARDLDMDEELIVEMRDRSFPKKNKRRQTNGV